MLEDSPMLRKICFFMILILTITGTAFGRSHVRNKLYRPGWDVRGGFNLSYGSFYNVEDSQILELGQLHYGLWLSAGYRFKKWGIYGELMPGINSMSGELKTATGNLSAEHSSFGCPLFLTARGFFKIHRKLAFVPSAGLGMIGYEFPQNAQIGLLKNLSTHNFAMKFGAGVDYMLNKRFYITGELNYMPAFDQKIIPYMGFNAGIGYRF